MWAGATALEKPADRRHSCTCYFLQAVYMTYALLLAHWLMDNMVLSSGMISLPSKFNEKVKDLSKASLWFLVPFSFLRWGSTCSSLCSWQWYSEVCKPEAHSSKTPLTAKQPPGVILPKCTNFCWLHVIQNLLMHLKTISPSRLE